MTADASYELQQAIVARLKADAAVGALIGDNIFDRIPRDRNGNIIVKPPYVSFGPEQMLPEFIDCIEGGDIVQQLDVWSDKPGRKEAKQIAKAIKASLDESSLVLTDNALVCFSFEGWRILEDPDGLTTHIAMTFQATVEEH